MSRLEVVCPLLMAAALSLTPCIARETTEVRPNIVFILADDMDQSEFGFLGGKVLTPNMDLLARDGVFFTRHYLAATVCSPSRAAFLTGRYRSRQSFARDTLKYRYQYVFFGRCYGKRDRNLPTLLRDAGYETGIVGKVDGFNPDDLNEPSSYRQACYDAGFTYAECLNPGNIEARGAAGKLNLHNADWHTVGALDFLERCKTTDKPFFLLIAHTVTHGLRHESFLADRRTTPEGMLAEAPDVLPSREDVLRRVAEAGFEEETATLTWQDDSVGAILRKLDDVDLADNTVVVLTADNGWAGGKGSCYNRGAHLPLLLYWKGRTENVPNCGQVVSSVDVVPTILDLCGVPVPKNMVVDGQSLVAAIDGGRIQDRAVLIEAGLTKAVVKDNWKYIGFRLPEDTLQTLPPKYQQEKVHTYTPLKSNHHLPLVRAVQRRHPQHADADQLYRLETDYREQTNLACEPKHRKRLDEMKSVMAQLLKGMPGSFGELKFEVAIREQEVAEPIHVEGDLDLTASYNVLAISDGSRPTADRYAVITYTGSRLGEFADVERVESFGYRVDYSRQGQVQLVRKDVDSAMAEAAAGKPNIVLLMADDLSAKLLSAYGGESFQTPHLDRIARQGLVFERCCATPYCSPTRVSLMTGKYNHRNYQRFNHMDMGERTFAQMLKGQGYTTCIAGKWHVGDKDKPGHFGFDYFYIDDQPGLNRMGNLEIPEVYENGLPLCKADVFAEFLLDFIRKNKDGPFFAYYPMVLVHGPHRPTPDMDIYRDAKKRQQPGPYFAEELRYMDKIVGRFYDTLDELGIRPNTILLFLADNGSVPMEFVNKGTTISGSKGTLSDLGIHVPLYASWAGKTPPGTRCHDLVDITDFFATFADAVGCLDTESSAIDGRSFLPQLRGEKGTPRQWAFSFFKGKMTIGPVIAEGGYAVRDDRWKLLHDDRLYDMARDPWEQNPLTSNSDTPESASARIRLQRVLDQLDVDHDDFFKLTEDDYRVSRLLGKVYAKYQRYSETGLLARRKVDRWKMLRLENRTTPEGTTELIDYMEDLLQTP